MCSFLKTTWTALNLLPGNQLLVLGNKASRSGLFWVRLSLNGCWVSGTWFIPALRVRPVLFDNIFSQNPQIMTWWSYKCSPSQKQNALRDKSWCQSNMDGRVSALSTAWRMDSSTCLCLVGVLTQTWLVSVLLVDLSWLGLWTSLSLVRVLTWTCPDWLVLVHSGICLWRVAVLDLPWLRLVSVLRALSLWLVTSVFWPAFVSVSNTSLTCYSLLFPPSPDVWVF